MEDGDASDKTTAEKLYEMCVGKDDTDFLAVFDSPSTKRLTVNTTGKRKNKSRGRGKSTTVSRQLEIVTSIKDLDRPAVLKSLNEAAGGGEKGIDACTGSSEKAVGGEKGIDSGAGSSEKAVGGEKGIDACTGSSEKAVGGEKGVDACTGSSEKAVGGEKGIDSGAGSSEKAGGGEKGIDACTGSSEKAGGGFPCHHCIRYAMSGTTDAENGD